MNRWTLTAAGTVILLSVCAAPRPAPAGEEGRPSTVRIGLIDSLFRDTPEPIMQIAMRPFKSILEERTGVTGQVMAGGDAEALARQLKDDQVQLGVFEGVEFAWARLKQPTLKPLLIAVNEHPANHAELVVRKDGKVAACADLQGEAVALPRMSREHCILFLERRCVSGGDAPQKCFKEVTKPGSAEDALDDVVDGAVQAAVVDAADLEHYQKNKPGRGAKLKALMESEPFPHAVIAYNPGTLNETLLQRFRDSMIEAKSTEKGKQLLKLCHITAFEAVPDNYDQLLSDIVKAYPPPTK